RLSRHGHTRARSLGGLGPLHGHPPRAAQDVGDVRVAVALVAHGRYRSAVRLGACASPVQALAQPLLDPLGHTGGRFSMKAPMPSWDSACIIFSPMTPAA